MPYITLTDLTQRFGEDEILSLTDTGSGEIGTELIDRSIEDACGEINGYVAAGGYAVPLTPVPSIIKAYACDIARYRLYDESALEQVSKRYDDAIKFLRAVAKGDVLLGISTTSPGTAETAGSVQFTTADRVMPGGGF
jgi:phage gp36-like protein